jgi:osmotically-inducible protein OsmY
MEADSRAARIERAIREVAELDVVVEDQGATIVLEGIVDSERDRQAAEDIATDLAGDAQIDNALEVQDIFPMSVDVFSDEIRSGDLTEDVAGITAAGGQVNPDFTDQQLETDPQAVAGPVSSADDDPAVDNGERAYVPPIDPVTVTGEDGAEDVLGGFEVSSMDDITTGEVVEDHGFGDEAIADAVRRELREDAATTDLEIRVIVRNGVVHLHGSVPDLEDADAAEEVAARVPGVREVSEELEVAAGM